MNFDPTTKDLWFTADSHFWHRNILEYSNRPFKTIEEMNEEIVKRWNEVVKPDDHIWHLGDIAFGGTKRTIEFIEKLKGIKGLIKGNHDYGLHFNQLEQYFPLGIYDLKELKFYDEEFKGDTIMILSHYPLAVWPKKHYGSWQPFAHCHGTYKSTHKVQFDVGVDCHNFYPISYEQIKRKLFVKGQ